MARLVEAAKADWVDAVDEGIVAEPLSPRIVDRWDFWDIALAAAPVIIVVIAVLT